MFVVKRFANRYGFNYNNLLQDKAVKKKGADKEVEHVLGVKDAEKREAMYLVNYKNGGFAIVSGDKRVKPVLAYSKINRLPVKTDEQVPGGLSIWIKNKVHAVSIIRSQKFKKDKRYASGWVSLLNLNKPDSVGKSKLEPPSPCQPWHDENGPLLQTMWGQGVGYNNFAPNYGCDVPYNGRAWGGCVATAIAQVMRYHQVPQSYEWSAMPDEVYNSSSYGSDQISSLMYDIGEEVDMNWGCDASGADDDDDIDNALHHFGYSAAHQIGYDGTANYEDVVDELEAGRPVIFSGCDKDHVLGIFPVANDFHAWVSDSFSRGTVCPSGQGTLYFSMNWGWDGSYYNGWFGFNDFSPGDGDGDYNYKSEVVVDIEP